MSLVHAVSLKDLPLRVDYFQQVVDQCRYKNQVLLHKCDKLSILLNLKITIPVCKK